MKTVPERIGGAKVIYYLPIEQRHKPTGNTEHIVAGRKVTNIAGLAICQYESDAGFYLFGCDSEWNSITDTVHESIEEAKDQAEFEFENTHQTWIKKD
jgi:hypothetical protein